MPERALPVSRSSDDREVVAHVGARDYLAYALLRHKLPLSVHAEYVNGR